MRLSVVIPAYNEAGYLHRTAADTAAVLDRFMPGDYEIIVVDDGSTDDTRAVAALAARDVGACRVLAYAPHVGKGHALRLGFEAATGDVVAFLDADGEIHPSALEPVLARLAAGGSAAVGRKVMADRRPWPRRVMRWGVRWIGRTAFGLPVTDPQTGIKAVVREHVWRAVRACREDGYLFDLELLALVHGQGLAIGEVDVEVHTLRPNRIPATSGVRQLRAAARVWRSYQRVRSAPASAAAAYEPAQADAPARNQGHRLAPQTVHLLALLSPPEEGAR